MDNSKFITLIDALLPQTQCTKCGYQGCKPYAEAIAKGEAINQCPPGGEETLHALAHLLDVPTIELALPAILPQVAFIREAECIGCTKCIQACPVDAIVGAAKLMHTVIMSECTGCDLCVAPCPVDCIEMRPLPDNLVPLTGADHLTEAQRVARKTRRDHARQRFEFRGKRLKQQEQERAQAREARLAKATESTQQPNVQTVVDRVKTQKMEGQPLTAEQKRLKIALAMAQVTLKKTVKQLQQYDTAALREQVSLLEAKVREAEQALQKALANDQPDQ